MQIKITILLNMGNVTNSVENNSERQLHIVIMRTDSWTARPASSSIIKLCQHDLHDSWDVFLIDHPQVFLQCV